jgi:DNA (cytosine-5)-methyltransferase 1
MAMRLLDLFSGIGGFSYAAEKLIGGYETVAFCEMDEFCQKVLKKHWPQVPIFDDVRTLDASRLGRIDICTFGFPCQPVSQAGIQKGDSDDRWLWDEIIRILQVSKPKWIIAENVKGLITIQDGFLLEHCISSLENEGYEIQPIIIPACAKNAPHRRDRVWIIGQLTTNTNDTGNRASKRSVDQEQQTIEQEWKEQSLFEPSRHDETMADTENNRWKQTEWQGGQGFRGRSKNISGSETERKEAERTNVADTKSIVKNGICRETNEVADRGNTWLELERSSDRQLIGKTKQNVANTKFKSSNCVTNSRSNSKIEKKKQKTRTTYGSSSGQNVSNTDCNGSKARLSGQDKGQVGNTEKPIDRDNRQRGWEKSNSRSVEQRMGYLDNGISAGLLRHFDREPYHIPRVTTGEKDRAKKLKALGNSIVPQVAAEILLAIRVTEESD